MRLAFLFLVLFTADAIAESMTTIGPTNASRCYRESLSPFSDFGLRFCDDALRNDDLLLRDRAATLTNRGIILAANGMFEDAMTDHNEAMLIAPEMGKIYVNRANVYHQQHDYQAAVDDYDKAIELANVPLDVVYFNRALTLIRMKRWDEARESLEKSLEANPDYGKAKRKLEQFNAPKETPSPAVVELEDSY